MDTPSPAVIRCSGLTRRFGALTAVDGLDLEVAAGEVVGLLGHNGAGKTTTIRLMNGILRPSSGTVEVLGLDPHRHGAEVRRRTGVLTETPALDDALSPRENLEVYGGIYGIADAVLAPRIEELLGRFDMLAHADGPVRGLSIGMKQRVSMARALLHDPEILFMDEPTSRMDPVAARRVRQLIAASSRERGRTVVLCTHNLAEAQELCDRVVILERGRAILSGTTEQLAWSAGTARAVRITVARETLDGAAAAVRGLPDVAQVEEEPAGLVVVPRNREAIADVVATLVAAGARIYGVQELGASLEDAYVAIHESTTRTGEPA